MVDEGRQIADTLVPKTAGDTAMEVDGVGAPGVSAFLFPNKEGLMHTLLEEKHDDAPLHRDPYQKARGRVLGALGDMSRARPASAAETLKDDTMANEAVTEVSATRDRIKRGCQSKMARDGELLLRRSHKQSMWSWSCQGNNLRSIAAREMETLGPAILAAKRVCKMVHVLLLTESNILRASSWFM